MLKCFYDYRFTGEMQKAFDGADRFYPITYQKDYAIVREVAEAAGEKFNRSAYEREAAKAKVSTGRSEAAPPFIDRKPDFSIRLAERTLKKLEISWFMHSK
jgi:hypothetical protein